MKSLQSRAWSRVLALILGLAAVPAIAGSATPATVSVGPLGIEWLPNVECESLALTVSGPNGQILRRELAAGGRVFFEPVGADGKPLPDGAYTYELVASPVLDRATRRALSNARRTGDDSILEKLRSEGKLPSVPLIQSGFFMVAGGRIIPPDRTEESPGAAPRPTSAASGLTPLIAADEVIPDDLIVQQSLCVGFDCVNGEVFDFDTVRLKENNTRIKFQDTSTGAGFASNDWQLTANDSASGGANKFSIEDITGAKVPFTVRAGAASNSIFVDSTGRVGFRTSTPVLDLHVSTGNTPALRLEQNNSGGFQAQTWDVAGNEANFFVRDVTNGSRLPFRIRPGAATSSLDISADGYVGVGTGSPGTKLDVEGTIDGEAIALLTNLSATGFSGFAMNDEGNVNSGFIGLDNAGNTMRVNAVNSHPLLLMTNSSEHLRVTTGGNVGINCNAPGSHLVIASGAGCANPASNLNAGAAQFTVSSSRTIKEHVEPVRVPGILDKVAAIEVYKYDFVGGPKDKLGLMAEDFHQIFQRGSDKTISGDEVQLALWLAVRELKAQNEALRRELEELKSKVHP